MDVCMKEVGELLEEQVAVLPVAVVANILQHVPQNQRLSSCALVCSSWATAAAAATTQLRRDTQLPLAKLSALGKWLEQHAKQMVSLDLSLYSAQVTGVPLQLPYHDLVQLTRLHLIGDFLHLPDVKADTAASGSIQPLLPTLHELLLGGCRLKSTQELRRLTCLRSVTSLDLRDIDLAFAGQLPVQQLSAAVSELLQNMTQLEELHCSSLLLDDTALQHVSALQCLQTCSVHTMGYGILSKTEDFLAALPRSLQELELSEGYTIPYDEEDQARPAGLPRQLHQLTELQRLFLSNTEVYPSAVASMTRLHALQVDQCQLLPNNQDSVTAFLAAVGRMQQLETLVVRDCNICLADVEAEAFSAVTASSALQALELVVEDRAVLPAGAAHYMFQPKKPLLHLSHLTLYTSSADDYTMDEAASCGMTGAEVQMLIKGCPALEVLSLCNVVRPGADVGDLLLQLPPSCTSLSMGGTAFGDAAAAAVKQLTQLKRLAWRYSPRLTDLGLEQLTALSRLTDLYCYDNCKLSPAVAAVDADVGVNHLRLLCNNEVGWGGCFSLAHHTASDDKSCFTDRSSQLFLGASPAVPC